MKELQAEWKPADSPRPKTSLWGIQARSECRKVISAKTCQLLRHLRWHCVDAFRARMLDTAWHESKLCALMLSPRELAGHAGDRHETHILQSLVACMPLTKAFGSQTFGHDNCNAFFPGRLLSCSDLLIIWFLLSAGFLQELWPVVPAT